MDQYNQNQIQQAIRMKITRHTQSTTTHRARIVHRQVRSIGIKRSHLGIVLLSVLLGAGEDELAALDGLLLLLGQGLLLLLGGPLLLALLLAEHRLRHRHLRRLGRHLPRSRPNQPVVLSHRLKRAANNESSNNVRRGGSPYLDKLRRRGGSRGGRRCTNAAAGVGRAGYVGGVWLLGFVVVIGRLGTVRDESV